MNETPNANRIQIGFFGKTNSGKSSLANAILGQDLSLVSDVKGTTTDPVYKKIEINPLGACVLIDTPGYNDCTQLGKDRVKAAEEVMGRVDIALLIFSDTDFIYEKKYFDFFLDCDIPVIPIVNKIDIIDYETISKKIEKEFNIQPILVSASKKEGLELIYKRLEELNNEHKDNISICGNLISGNDIVLLVMPQDVQAPKGRLILPQVQTIRDLLDNKCIVVSTTYENYELSLNSLKQHPKLIITDSQLFKEVYNKKNENSIITSFSVLFSKYKGDIELFVKNAHYISKLDSNSKVLIAEACTHKVMEEDIGRVKIPRLLKEKVDRNIKFDIVSGNDLPDEIDSYDIIIHCGGCMFSRRHILNRIKKAKEHKVPITNYGIAIAYLNGILEKIKY